MNDDPIEQPNERSSQRIERSAYVARWDPAEGRIVLGPQRKKPSNRFPLVGTLLLLILLMIFKASLYILAGDAAYQRGLNELAAGNLAEQFAAWAMQPDPMTREIARLVRLLSPW